MPMSGEESRIPPVPPLSGIGASTESPAQRGFRFFWDAAATAGWELAASPIDRSGDVRPAHNVTQLNAK